MRQKVSNPKLKSWQGMLLIVGIVALLMVFQFVAAFSALMIGGANSYTIASFALWIFGGVVALQLLRAFIMEYLYTVESLQFQIFRVYGRFKPRLAVTVITRSILAFGTPEEIQGKFPETHPHVYTRSRCRLPVKALAYESDGKICVAHIQPDEAFSAKLEACALENRKKK